MTSTNWLADVPDNEFDIVEVLFKNTRRGFYRNRILRVLLVFILSSIGSSIGTFAGGADVIRQFSEVR